MCDLCVGRLSLPVCLSEPFAVCFSFNSVLGRTQAFFFFRECVVGIPRVAGDAATNVSGTIALGNTPERRPYSYLLNWGTVPFFSVIKVAILSVENIHN